MKALQVLLALCASVAAVGTATASAAAPSQPPGCVVVLGTPAATTGSAQGLAQKEAAYTRVCLP
jgi:hypothetical protein